jgi:hypothetical protein
MLKEPDLDFLTSVQGLADAESLTSLDEKITRRAMEAARRKFSPEFRASATLIEGLPRGLDQ